MLTHGNTIGMWSVDTGDIHPKRPTPEAMVKTVLAQATPGGIVLMHDGGGNHRNTVKAVPQIIAKLFDKQSIELIDRLAQCSVFNRLSKFHLIFTPML